MAKKTLKKFKGNDRDREKIMSDEGPKPFKFGGGTVLESEEERSIYAVIAKLTLKVTTLKTKKKMIFLKYAIKDIKVGKGTQLKRQADHDEKIQRHKQTLEQKNKTGTSLETTMQELNQRIKTATQKHAVDSETETAYLQKSWQQR